MEKMAKRPLVLVLLLATLVVSTAAVAFGHAHDSAVARQCDVCHVGHLPVVQPTDGVGLCPPAPVEWHTLTEKSFHVPEYSLRSHPSRAPPA